MLSWYSRRRKTKSQKRKTSKELGKKWIKVGHIPDALAEILFPLMKSWKVYLTKTMISENHRDAPEGKWVPGGGIPYNYELFGPKIHKNLLERK